MTTSFEDTDFTRLRVVLLRRSLPLLLATVVAGGAAYVLSSRQTPVYEAVSSLMMVQEDGGNDRLSASVFTAPTLPRGILPEALQSRRVMQGLINNLQALNLPAATLQSVRQSAEGQLRLGEPSVVNVVAVGDGQQEGVFEVHGRASTPAGAQALADAGAGALLEWDARRAQERLAQLRSSFVRQITVLDTRLGRPASATTPLEVQTLRAARSQVIQSLAQVTALEQSTSGTLQQVAGAALPSRASSPQPVKSAVLAALLTLLLATGVALLFDRVRRPVYGEADLRPWRRPLLGHLPSLRPRTTGQQVLTGSGAEEWQVPVGFLRVNLQARLAASTSGRVVITSVRRGAGSSSVTAALATSLSKTGERVLIVDADLQRATQSSVWLTLNPRALPAERFSDPATGLNGVFPLVSVKERIDLLPADALRKNGGLALAELRRLLEALDANYDVVLIDAPPLLTSPDAVNLAGLTAGLVMLLVPGKTNQDEVEAAFAAAHAANAEVLGLVFNESPARSGADRQAYRPQGTAARTVLAGEVSTP